MKGTISGRSSRDFPAWRLALAFGLLAFLQGVAEPTEGLSAQPVRATLRAGGQGVGAVAAFSSVASLPWALKPLFGLLTDFVPLGRSRRKGYLIVAGGLTTIAFLALAMSRAAPGWQLLLTWLLLATFAVGLADVATDALVVEWGQIHGQTGRFQAVVWSCLYASGIATGAAGGYFSAAGRLREAFAVCTCAGVGMLALAVLGVREPERRDSPRAAAAVGSELRAAMRSPAVVSVGLFTALWNFNPLSNPILHLHMTGALGLSQQTFGNALSLFSVTSLAAAMGYGFYCSTVGMSVLVHVSVVLGIVANLAYAAIVDESSAGFATAAVGFAYMTATLIQFDLAARACPPGAAGTIFASLMAVANLSTLVSTWLGGLAYERLGAAWGYTTAFRILIGLSALFTAGCWLIVPRIPRSILSSQTAVGSKSD